jgi:hypothetical protein
MSPCGLWHDHASTPRQQEIAFPKAKRRGKPTQADLLLTMLREARRSGRRGRPVDLPEIMRVGIAQHGARFDELHRRRFDIQNEIEREAHGRVLSRYRLRHDPEQDGYR